MRGLSQAGLCNTPSHLPMLLLLSGVSLTLSTSLLLLLLLLL
jgi:hypothetical protein